MNDIMVSWVVLRNKHVRTLKTLLTKEQAMQLDKAHYSASWNKICQDLVDALEFAISRLQGLPEHWVIDEMDGQGKFESTSRFAKGDLGCLLCTALLNGPTLKGKLSDAEAVALAEEAITALEELGK